MNAQATIVAILTFVAMASGHAGGITGSVGGPGGSGTVTVDDNGQVHVSKTFTSLDYLDLTITVAANAVPDRYFGETIVNSTGLDWYDFHFSLISAAPAASYIEVPLHAPFSISAGDLVSVDLGRGLVPTGGVFLPGLGVHIVDPDRLGYSYTIRQIPSIPEPSTLLLCAGGLALLLGIKFQRHTAAGGPPAA